MNVVNRDMSEAEKARIRSGQSNMAGLIADLESGQIFLEDLGEEQVDKLRMLLEKK